MTLVTEELEFLRLMGGVLEEGERIVAHLGSGNHYCSWTDSCEPAQTATLMEPH